jgi:hypothetical protein
MWMNTALKRRGVGAVAMMIYIMYEKPGSMSVQAEEVFK